MTNNEGEKPDIEAGGAGYYHKYVEANDRARDHFRLQMAYYAFGLLGGEEETLHGQSKTQRDWSVTQGALVLAREAFRARELADAAAKEAMRRLGASTAVPEGVWVKRLVEGTAEHTRWTDALAMVDEVMELAKMSRRARKRLVERHRATVAQEQEAIAGMAEIGHMTRDEAATLLRSVTATGQLASDTDPLAEQKYRDHFQVKAREMRRRWAMDILKEVSRIAPGLPQFSVMEPVSAEAAEAMVEEFYRHYPGLAAHITESRQPDMQAWDEVRRGHVCEEVHPAATHAVWKKGTFYDRYAQNASIESTPEKVGSRVVRRPIHLAPVSGLGLMPCCGQKAGPNSQCTSDPFEVTCRGAQ